MKEEKSNLYNRWLRGEQASVVEEVVKLQRRTHDDQFERQPSLRADPHNSGEKADQNVREDAPLVRLVHYNHRIAAQQKVLRREQKSCEESPGLVIQITL